MHFHKNREVQDISCDFLFSFRKSASNGQISTYEVINNLSQ